MDSPNFDYQSLWSSGGDDDTDSELYDTAMLLEDDESEAKAPENEADVGGNDDERHNFSPKYCFPSGGFSSHWTQASSKEAEICGNHQISQCSPPPLPSDNGPSAGNSVGVVTNLSSPPWLYQNDTKHPIVGAGMENLGNTCFMNSVLQCFIHTVPLLRGFLSDGHLVHSNCNKEGFCLLCALRDLIVGSLTNSVVWPCTFADNLSYISSTFQRFHQEDAHEFLQGFLDRLESCHDSERNGCMSSRSDNIVKQVFGGRLVSNLKCCNCGHCSDTFEPSVDLSLEIKDVDNLLTALQSFTKIERIEDPETKFTCEKCKEQVSVEKRLSFDQAPSVAVFHLKRFENEGSFVQKIDKHVAFPLELDLLPYTGGGKKNDGELKYVLYAIMVHIGLTSTSGHYYCFIRISSNMWCKFDDSKVVLVHEDVVLSQQAYILFYAKESTPWYSSFIEEQKKFVHSTIWNTSPKSVLENLSSVYPSLEYKFGHNSNVVRHDFGSEHSGADDNEIKHSGPIVNKIESNRGTSNKCIVPDLVAPRPSQSSDVFLSKAQKVSPILLEKVKQNKDLKSHQDDTQPALRSPSPEIYREDPPVFSIPRDHLRLVNSLSCKRRLEEDMDDMEIKQAYTFIKKTMHSSRGQQLLAAIRGPKPEAFVNRKKSKISDLSDDSSAPIHRDSKIRPSLRRLPAGTDRQS